MEPELPQWEYCQLVFVGARIPTARLPGPHVMTPAESRTQPGPTPSHTPTIHAVPTAGHYHLQLVYAGPDGTVTDRQLATFEQEHQHNPFYEAIGLLGGAGWELVAMEPSRDFAWSVDDREVVPYAAGLRPVSRVAHFKRRVQPGRRADEPAIELRQQ